jgi:hypothetical protein
MTGHAGAPISNPSPEQLAPALESLRKGEGGSPSVAPDASPAVAMPSAEQAHSEP